MTIAGKSRSLITLEGIDKTYPSDSLWKRMWGKERGKTALRDITLEVEMGEVLYISGDNGAGKTTLLKVIMGLLLPDGGEILRDDSVSDMEEIGYAGSGERCFYYRLTGWQNLKFFSLLKGISTKEVRSFAGEPVERFNIMHVMDNRYQTFSAGEKRKLNLLRSIVPPNPPLLIIDEFGDNIDKKSLAYLKEIVLNLKRNNSSIILASPNPHIAEDITDNYLHLKEGSIAYYGNDISGIPED
jgi:ABC-2 type transport system ATP-binding protein